MVELIIYKDLCYRVTGLAFEVYNSIGPGLKEKIYSNALEELLKQEKIKYQRELYHPIKIREKIISKSFFDFLIEESLIVELKSGNDNYRNVCNQLYQYLKESNLKLGLIIRFTKDGVRVKRIPNLY